MSALRFISKLPSRAASASVLDKSLFPFSRGLCALLQDIASSRATLSTSFIMLGLLVVERPTLGAVASCSGLLTSVVVLEVSAAERSGLILPCSRLTNVNAPGQLHFRTSMLIARLEGTPKNPSEMPPLEVIS